MKAMKTRFFLKREASGAFTQDAPVVIEVNDCLREIEELERLADKQIPMQAYYEFDNEFRCPSCSHEDDVYDVRTLKFCPECGQKLRWN